MNRVVIAILLMVSTLATVDAAGGLIHIWDGTGVGSHKVTLEAFPVAGGGDKAAVIVCPGGSYSWLDYDTEGTAVARWLNANGITAFVLRYRVQGVFQFITHSRAVFGGNKHPNQIQDAQMALLWVRSHAADYAISTDRIGIMGFSAGGHLAMMAAEMWRTDFLAPLGIDISGVSLRPDFAVPVYPVVSMADKCTHRRSRRALLGEGGQRNHELRDSLSLEHHVDADCPPVFLVNCADDPVVKCRNSELLDSALTAHGIVHRYIQYSTGGHGFGASDTKGTVECRQWKREFIDWIASLFND